MKFKNKILTDEFSGKIAIVTGSGTGNREAIAARLFVGGAKGGFSK